ncbi:benzoyl-CoA-dihydrodiol lyase [Rhodobium orientis]|uniref:Benzoyl-CoA-dihydrodiol lyase n=1 Tax=Rhodobium orientis TaxID=34017 RepID=A0A327JEZ1_9HYPH|nr:2,3-epoxybenzoyl-CoA dihydrolase [Rhodobium orientis]MBB4305708.1 benzoyl-CoA-dihydrodiol lyase [Rhodobium orientis]MBK5947877.1 benzoyl-CoA-dihydrodiol lyase [Rhodobium orientis]RAI24304.1 benzoyl-CoA-dihydrodiol lyase [Rhodobium orientis]
MTIDFQTDPSKYRHWRIDTDGPIATLTMDVDENGGLFEGYQLKLNSYDLGVDIELADAIQRLRFEHPEVKAVVLKSGKDRVFCAGANIRMLGGATHAHKVNFCKFTNETRNAMEAAGTLSGQTYIAAVQGACAGGGYELALATDHIILTDDGASSVALPEVPLLAVLPGTGGLTRVTDKRKVRRDLADVFCSIEEGIKGKRAVDWRLVDEIATNSKFDEVVAERANEIASRSDRPDDAKGVSLTSLTRTITDNAVTYSTVSLELDRETRIATITITGPETDAPADTDALASEGADAWCLKFARELDDAILHLRFNEPDTAAVVFKTVGDPEKVVAHEAFLIANDGNWLAREILLYWQRLFKRVDLTSRTLVALVEPGSCFAGPLAEIAFAADRSYMLIGQFEGDNRPEATLTLTEGNFGRYPMSNDLTRLQTRFLGEPESVDKAKAACRKALDASEADEFGLVTFAYDDIDWEDEIRIFLEERASFSPDALTGMEANLRFAGPETMETRIFGRLTAWQNWIFQRPNAVGENGALRRYGSGIRGDFDTTRV